MTDESSQGDRPEKTSRFSTLVREEENSPGTEFVYAFECLVTAHDILEANFRELKAIPDQFDTDRTLIHAASYPARRALLLEFVRRLHNYLAAAKTLVDHTRAFRSRHVSDAAFDAECDDRVKQLLDDPVIKFLQDLRNPVLHSCLPRVELTITDTAPDDQLRTQLTLSVKELLTMHDWSVAARRYIEEAQEGYYVDNKYVDLGAVAVRYQQTIATFYNWFYQSVLSRNRPLVAEFVERREELIRIQAAKMKNSGVNT